MKVTILGAGVGALNYLPDKTLNKYPPAFLVQWGKDNKVLFECSHAVDQRLEKAGIDYTSIHHLAISHPHPDHCVPLPFIQSVYLKGLWGGEKFKNKQLSLYGPDYLIENFQTLWNIHLPERKNTYFDWPKLSLIPMSKGVTVQIGEATLISHKVYHAFGKCDAVAYRLETPEGIFAYSGDTGECEGVREMAKNADLFICEAGARVSDTKNPTGYGHLNPYVAGDIAKKSQVRKLMLFHYTGLDTDEEVIVEIKRSGFTGEIVMGKDSQVITSMSSLKGSL